LLGPDDVARCAAALQVQASRDFAVTWGIDAQVRVAEEPGEDEEPLYLLDDVSQAEGLGFHGRTAWDRPCGFVLVRPTLSVGDSWQATASHELLEMLADPLVNLAEEGIHHGRPALFALEVCDPVENEEYEIAGIAMSNFVLPTWFVNAPLPDDALVDFLGRLSDPFTLSPGGYASYCTELGRWQQWFAKRCPKHQRQPGTHSRRRRRHRSGQSAVGSGQKLQTTS
ncbi:MAG TPA: hypothetical protein VKI65_17300, partial [Gemmataceae bacterium]|nr:hypothetical protein [Gemmataceae bacterium]